MNLRDRHSALEAIALLFGAALVADALSFGDTTPKKAHWTDHPILKTNPDIKPPIVAIYTTRTQDEEHTVGARGIYYPQGSNYLLADRSLEDTEEARVLLDYDVLQFTPGSIKERPNMIQLETTRDSKVCLLMTVRDNGFKMGREATMKPPAGYTNVGAVRWSEDLGPREIPQTRFNFQGMAACKSLPAGEHNFTSPDMLGAEFNVHRYSLLFAEADGTPSLPPALPSGWEGPEIKPLTRCPDALHDMWVVENHDVNDPDTSGKVWRTWHPQKDYIYGCYYGHEHGTPGMLAGYTEKLDYTAWKNFRQDESHNGFKSYVLPVPQEDKFLVINLHADTSDIGRVDKEFHTMVVAVTEKDTGKHLMELSCKASTGGSACDFENLPEEGFRFFPVGNDEAQSLVREAYGGERSTWINARKRMNCWRPNNFDTRLGRNDDNPARGDYERWFMKTQGEFCMYSPRLFEAAGPEVDIKDPQTGTFANMHDSCFRAIRETSLT